MTAGADGGFLQGTGRKEGETGRGEAVEPEERELGAAGSGSEARRSPGLAVDTRRSRECKDPWG